MASSVVDRRVFALFSRAGVCEWQICINSFHLFRPFILTVTQCYSVFFVVKEVEVEQDSNCG